MNGPEKVGERYQVKSYKRREIRQKASVDVVFSCRGVIFSAELSSPRIWIIKWKSVSDRMAFCLCLIVISAVLSAVQGKSGPINGSRETPTSPCQSIYSFQKLDFENLKNSRE